METHGRDFEDAAAGRLNSDDDRLRHPMLPRIKLRIGEGRHFEAPAMPIKLARNAARRELICDPAAP